MQIGTRIVWGAQETRVVFFTNTPIDARIDDLFQIALGGRPQTYHEAPNHGAPFAAAQASAIGPHGQISLLKAAGRIDLFYNPWSNEPGTVTYNARYD